MSFENMGKPIPENRRDAAYSLAREWGIERETAFTLVQRMANHLERDHPHEAMEAATEVLDLTGAYRFMAILLTDPVRKSC